MSVTALQEKMLGLPAAERARLIDVLWKSIPEPEQQAREAAWAKESERRIDAFGAGKISARDVAETLAELKKLCDGESPFPFHRRVGTQGSAGIL